MFNPFKGDVLKKVIENIKKHKAHTNKKIILIYVNPVAKDYFKEFTIMSPPHNQSVLVRLVCFRLV